MPRKAAASAEAGDDSAKPKKRSKTETEDGKEKSAVRKPAVRASGLNKNQESLCFVKLVGSHLTFCSLPVSFSEVQGRRHRALLVQGQGSLQGPGALHNNVDIDFACLTIACDDGYFCLLVSPNYK
jgi:hypothetical protein